MRTLRGQAAMEYLATYGWALLAMFAVVAILLGSGMLGAGRFTSEECSFAPNLPCSSGYFKPVAGDAQKLALFVNITNTQGFPMLITACYFKLVGGERDGVSYISINDVDECVRQVPQGGWFSHEVEMGSVQRVNPVDMRKAYITYTFKNCQDAPGDDADARFGQCYSDDVRFPLHNTSGRLVASMRG